MKKINTYNDFLNQKYLQDFINEGLIKSIDYEKFKAILDKFLNKNIKEYTIDISNDQYIKIIFDNKLLNKNIVIELLKIINNLGYFISSYYLDDFYYINEFNIHKIKDINKIVLYINKKYEDELVDKNITKFYHITLYDIWINKIIPEGALIPKISNIVNNNPRILYLHTNPDLLLGFIYEKRFNIKQKLSINKNISLINLNYNKFILLEIDIKLLGGLLKIMKDNKMQLSGSYYTFEPIPIRIIKPIAIKDIDSNVLIEL